MFSNRRPRYITAQRNAARTLEFLALIGFTRHSSVTIPEEKTLGKAIGGLVVSNDTPVVVYSTEMMAWATRIWWVLQYAEHRNVRVLNGGLKAWKGGTRNHQERICPRDF
ncbi:MAG TPA: hypothetical protein EYG52_10605 [Pseudomonadales bacterium]|nr:hypothetical protein [Gammaproteobacteria bacterium]HIL83948.1 hypothetical protein [Pseudomonadales bacterium]